MYVPRYLSIITWQVKNALGGILKLQFNSMFCPFVSCGNGRSGFPRTHPTEAIWFLVALHHSRQCGRPDPLVCLQLDSSSLL